jgi:type IV pilus assembly protein PilW
MAIDRRRARTRRAGRQSRRFNAGMTLVELMVAVAIGLFMIAALVALYVNNSTARTELDRSSRQIENGRFAIDMMRDDIALAGYYGEIAPADIVQFTQADPCTTTQANLGWSTAAAPTPARLPAAIEGAETLATIPAGWSCSGLNKRAGTGFLVVRRLRPAVVPPAAAVASTQYVQHTGCLDGITRFQLGAGPGATNFPLLGPYCIALSPVREYTSRFYYVSTCGICSPSDGVPTLRMRELIGNTVVETVVADGIEDLQVEFGRDTNNDGVVDDYVTTGAAADWRNVVAVRLWVISRSTTASPGYVDDKTYDRGAFGTYTPATADRAFKRRLYTSLVHMPNVAGPREMP